MKTLTILLITLFSLNLSIDNNSIRDVKQSERTTLSVSNMSSKHMLRVWHTYHRNPNSMRPTENILLGTIQSHKTSKTIETVGDYTYISWNYREKSYAKKVYLKVGKHNSIKINDSDFSPQNYN